MDSSDWDGIGRESFREEKIMSWQLFRGEVALVHEYFVAPLIEKYNYVFVSTCYAYILTCFSWIDLFAGYWNRAGIRNQTDRMTMFMHHFIGTPTKVGKIAINIWRHPLAHEGGIRLVNDTRSLYVPRATWTLPANVHMIPVDTGHWVEPGPPHGKKVFDVTVGVFNLMDDVERGMNAYFAALSTDPVLQQRFKDEQQRLDEETF